MQIYEQDGGYVAETIYQSERIVKFGRTTEEARERLLTTLMVIEMIG